MPSNQWLNLYLSFLLQNLIDSHLKLFSTEKKRYYWGQLKMVLGNGVVSAQPKLGRCPKKHMFRAPCPTLNIQSDCSLA